MRRWLAVASAEPARVEPGVARSARPTGRRGTSSAAFSSCRRTSTKPLSPEVDAFLAAGPAPVFMGFGSLMPIGGTRICSRPSRRSRTRRASPAAARSSRPRSSGRPRDRVLFVQAHAAQAGVSALRGRGPSCRRRHHAHDACAPACRRCRCRTCRISSGGPKSCSASASRRRRLRRTRWTAATLAVAHHAKCSTTPRMKQAAMAMQRADADRQRAGDGRGS